MNEVRPGDEQLTSALRAIAADEQTRGASPSVEARVLAEVRSMARRRMRTRAFMVAAAAALFVAMALPVWQPSTRDEVVADRDPAAAGATGTHEEVTEFFPLTYSSVPVRGGQVVRLQVPRAALARFGVSEFHAADDGAATVLAEVVVGNDGLARAVRFVRAAGISDQQEQKQ
jgi:predicted transcriptional regulator